VIAQTANHQAASNGLHPLRLRHHWRPVLSLIELAFGEALDAEARRALQGMRPPALIAPLIALLDDLSPPGEGMMPGFVWLENGHVIGTASVRRVHASSRGWLISNVAVHPEKQGRGIGRALLEACLDLAQDHGGTFCRSGTIMWLPVICTRVWVLGRSARS
jgi:GNAT superfamily N-acetyltransferase